MSTKRTIRRSLAIASVALAFPAVAGAIPVNDNDDDPPLNAAPVASFTITPNPALYSPQPVVAQARTFGPEGIYRSGDVVKFDGSASHDSDGQIVKYEYDLDGNGTYEVSGTNPKASRRYTQLGTYTIRLRVTDDGNKTRVVTHQLVVHAPPQARLKASTALALVGQSVEFDGTTSTDADGIVKYELDLDGDGTFEKVAPTATTAFTSLGEHVVRLRVTDAHGATGTDVARIVVHRAPTAAFAFAPNPGVAGEPVALDGSGSSDDGTVAKYEWDLDGDGTFETDTQGSPSASVTYPTPGTYTVKLRVTDDHGVQDAVAHQLTVNAKPDTTVTAADVDAPLVRVLTRSAKLHRGSIVRVKVACPATETTCAGRLVLRTPGKVLGRKAFSLAGGQQKVLKVRIAKGSVKRRIQARAVATATDAAGNRGTTRKVVTIKR